MSSVSGLVLSRISVALQRLVNLRAGEGIALFWAFSYFFALMCSYYILRPMRDEMGIAGGVDRLHWLFTGTFVVMLAVVPVFGWVTTRFPRKRFLPYVYYFFIANILVFYALFESHVTHAYIARAFFIWVSVFNLFVVSVFWSFMADIFHDLQAKRLFGFIAAGGTVGALVGPALTTFLVVPLGTTNMLLISAALLGWAILSIRKLANWRLLSEPDAETRRQESGRQERPLAGGLLDGVILVLRSPYLLGICVLMLLFTMLATFLYFEQAYIIRAHFADSNERTAVFAAMDLAVNGLTILMQVFLTGRLINRLGLSWTLALLPILLGVGFLVLGLAPELGVLIVVQVLRRAGNYAIMRPAREVLYVLLRREEKYKAKNFIDTVVYRGGDALSAWGYSGLHALGLGLGHIAFLAVPLSMLWAWVAYRLGKKQMAMAADPANAANTR